MKSALLTIVKNESIFLPIWLKHYKNHFDPSDIYILDHQSIDGSTDNTGCNVEVVKNDDAFDAKWLLKTVTDKHRELLKEYKYVVFAEADEIIHHKSNCSLSYVLDYYDRDVIRCNGFEVIHHYETEPDIDLNKNILKQRSKWYNSETFSKPTITKIPVNWCLGFHNCNYCVDINEDFLLIHLHRFDFNYTCERNNKNTSYNLSKESINNAWGWQNYTDRKGIVKYWKKLFKPLSGIEDIPKEYEGIV